MSFHEAEGIRHANAFEIGGKQVWTATHRHCGGSLTLVDGKWICSECSESFSDEHCADLEHEEADRAAREAASAGWDNKDEKKQAAALKKLEVARATQRKKLLDHRASRLADARAHLVSVAETLRESASQEDLVVRHAAAVAALPAIIVAHNGAATILDEARDLHAAILAAPPPEPEPEVEPVTATEPVAEPTEPVAEVTEVAEEVSLLSTLDEPEPEPIPETAPEAAGEDDRAEFVRTDVDAEAPPSPPRGSRRRSGR